MEQLAHISPEHSTQTLMLVVVGITIALLAAYLASSKEK